MSTYLSERHQVAAVLHEWFERNKPQLVTPSLVDDCLTIAGWALTVPDVKPKAADPWQAPQRRSGPAWLTALEIEHEHLAPLTPDHPYVRELAAEIASVKARIARARLPPPAPNNPIDFLSGKIRGLLGDRLDENAIGQVADRVLSIVNEARNVVPDEFILR
jgi:hypothetical protein